MEDEVFENQSNRINQSYSRDLSFFSINYYQSFTVSLAYETIGSDEVLPLFAVVSFGTLIYR